MIRLLNHIELLSIIVIKVIIIQVFGIFFSKITLSITSYLNITTDKRIQSRELSIMIVLGALGGVASVPLGYAGRLFTPIPFLYPILSQTLSGMHIFWLILAAILTRRGGAGTVTGILKGLVEAFLYSHLGVLVIFISTVEGLFVDMILYVLGRNKSSSIYVASGFSSASNVMVLILVVKLPEVIFLFMFLSSFLSGLIFGGYVGEYVFNILPKRFSVSESHLK